MKTAKIISSVVKGNILSITTPYGEVNHKLYEQTHDGVTLADIRHEWKAPYKLLVQGWTAELPHPPRPEDARFTADQAPEQVVGYDDGMGRRSCHIRAWVYCRNNIYPFEGKTIPGILLIEEESYNKNGKWSSTYYKIRVAEGYRFASKRQDWESGRYIDNVASVKAMLADLGITDVTMDAGRDFLMTQMGGSWFRHIAFVEAREAMYDKGIQDTIEITFTKTKGTRRQGDLNLLIDGEVWDKIYNPMDGKVVVKSQIGNRYILMVSAESVIEELYEWDYDGDSLQERGFTVKTGADGYFAGWEKKVESPSSDNESGNTPFEDLLKVVFHR